MNSALNQARTESRQAQVAYRRALDLGASAETIARLAKDAQDATEAVIELSQDGLGAFFNGSWR